MLDFRERQTEQESDKASKEDFYGEMVNPHFRGACLRNVHLL